MQATRTCSRLARVPKLRFVSSFESGQLGLFPSQATGGQSRRARLPFLATCRYWSKVVRLHHYHLLHTAITTCLNTPPYMQNTTKPDFHKTPSPPMDRRRSHRTQISVAHGPLSLQEEEAMDTKVSQWAPLITKKRSHSGDLSHWAPLCVTVCVAATFLHYAQQHLIRHQPLMRGKWWKNAPDAASTDEEENGKKKFILYFKVKRSNVEKFEV